MVQQIITLCDVCAEANDDGAVAAQTHLVAVAGGAWSLDLCPAHYEMLVEPLADVAERLGEVVKGEAKAKAFKPRTKTERRGGGGNRPLSEPCMICGAVFGMASSLTSHYQNVHDINGFREAYGLTCPLCLHEGGGPSALGRHVRDAHPEVQAAEGGSGAPEVFRYASEHGDPHDLVAKRLAELGLTALPERVKP